MRGGRLKDKIRKRSDIHLIFFSSLISINTRILHTALLPSGVETSARTRIQVLIP